MRDRRVGITGLGLNIADATRFIDYLEIPAGRADVCADTAFPSTGLRYKDQATKAALRAAKAALEHAGLPCSPQEQLEPQTFGVVVSSNLGNLDTVGRVAAAIQNGGVDETSPMDLPNASSNVISASVAIWFGLGALNLMVCNGATSGLDACHVAANAIRSGRAERMLVVGVEVATEPAAKLMRESAKPWLRDEDALAMHDCAGAVVLESEFAAAGRGATVYAQAGRYGFHASDLRESIVRSARSTQPEADLWLVPNCTHAPAAERVRAARGVWRAPGPTTFDVAAALGETYGAEGIFQCIAAALWLRAHQRSSALATSGAAWGRSSSALMLHREAPS